MNVCVCCCLMEQDRGEFSCYFYLDQTRPPPTVTNWSQFAQDCPRFKTVSQEPLKPWKTETVITLLPLSFGQISTRTQKIMTQIKQILSIQNYTKNDLNKLFHHRCEHSISWNLKKEPYTSPTPPPHPHPFGFQSFPGEKTTYSVYFAFQIVA